MVSRETLDGFQGGLQIGGHMCVNNLPKEVVTRKWNGRESNARPSEAWRAWQRERESADGMIIAKEANGERQHNVLHTHSE